MKRPKSVNRLQAREASQKILPAVKILSSYMHNVNPKTPSDIFHGYEVSAGEFEDKYGVKCQLQIRAIRLKSGFIKEGNVKPIVNKWAIMFKIRVFLMGLAKWAEEFYNK